MASLQKIHRSFSRQILAHFCGGSLKGEDMHEPWRPLKFMNNLDKVIRKRRDVQMTHTGLRENQLLSS
jgi:hypothetical protein